MMFFSAHRFYYVFDLDPNLSLFYFILGSSRSTLVEQVFKGHDTMGKSYNCRKTLEHSIRPMAECIRVYSLSVMLIYLRMYMILISFILDIVYTRKHSFRQA